ncbi:ABC transporter permease (plasmid) [Deinococcus metallilatus]|uniref:Xylose transport system permease protein XylH n=2 Tax=Deinococcus metallilatus TaxID=1211322 RepID=A0AAJ5K1S3_9DEIO|nr:ABC transporter permease [Deinococcus metallilatus]MBB5295623.1 simple sugar transport system permease protein [Deinococcus metallilatus]QBY06913.1 ABC transporter permease [Deinococcus metallilatus]TLK32303.1 ABC transporter permease [Deinococcus metallilatus]GMA14152.1 sugar ABC transporter [Deinococcus metallilatus]
MSMTLRDERLRKVSLWRRLLVRPEFGSLAGLLVVFGVFSLFAGSQGFLSVAGTVNYLEVAAQLGIIAVAAALLMIGGEFDLSIGSMIGLTGMIVGLSTAQYGLPLWAGILLAFVVAGLLGALNGWVVLKTGLPSFIITLASLFILRGLTVGVTLLLTNNTRVSGVEASGLSAALFQSTPLGLPVSVWWWLGLGLVMSFVLLRTRFGNWIFAAGGDPHAARNVGVPVGRVKITLFVLTALSAALLATIQVLNTGSADVLRGTGKELEAIASAVIGGCLLTGGYGSVIGAMLGALMLGMVQQGLFFTGIDTNWFQVFVGGLLLAAVVLNNFLRKKAIGR